VRALLLVAALAACGDDAGGDDGVLTFDAAPAGRAIVAGEGVGGLRLGMRWAEARALLGEPSIAPVVLVRLAHVRWPEAGVEALLTSPDDTTLTDDALVIGVAATAPADFTGEVRPGASRAAIEAALGVAPEELAGRAYYPAGLSVAYTDDVASLVAVVPSYVLAPEPPPMAPAQGVEVLPIGGATRRGVVVDGETLPVVDMHLHPGDFSTMAPTGKAFILASLPPFLAPYVPELLDRLSDPWAPHVGIAAQLEMADVAHGVLYAVYTPASTGYQTNEGLEQLLADPRNTAGEDPLFWGFASINFEDWSADLAGERLEALASYFATAPELFLGIKLAHAHQGVSFADTDYHGVYEVAAEHGVPVLLHTGFSPFPGTRDDPAYYDPLGLEPLITAYDGAHGLPRVDFVLSHVGQGDARAVAHALDLAEAHDNVWLELSALGRPLLVDADGRPVSGGEPQYQLVLAELAARGLIDRALFASDGPQSSGGVRSYLGRLLAGMQEAGYTTAEIGAVLSGNFARLYLDRDQL
jgi:predicted TIM-barrel fold metal-dependent hydrolase